MTRTLLKARWVVGHEGGGHCLYENGEVVVEGERILFVGHDFPGEVAERIDFGNALIGPGFIDLNALSDLDTSVLGYDNQPPERKGRVWPDSYMKAGPREMYSADELAFQKRYAFTRLIRNGTTTGLPIASLFYREWGETTEEFAAAAAFAGELGLRVYLGPAYRTGNIVVGQDGGISQYFDEERGLRGLEEAEAFCRRFEGTAGGLVRTMFAPDRIETCTPELLRRTAEAGRALEVPVRLHCCQALYEYDSVVEQHGMSPPEWLESIGFLGPRVLLPHGIFVSGINGVERPGHDLEILAGSGATIVHCPAVAARGGWLLRSFSRYRALGINIGLGTDTHPPDMIQNMTLAVVLARIAESNASAASAADLYDAATLGGAAALGRPDLGRLAPGAAADLNVIDFDNPFMGQNIDPIQTLILNGSGREVTDVMIAGRFVMREGVIPGVDDRALRKKAQAQYHQIVAQYPDRTLGHPHVDEIFQSSYPRRSSRAATPT